MLLVLSVSWSINLASKTHCHMEDLLMVRTVMAYGSVFRDLAPLLLPVFLKLGLVVFIGDTVSDDLLNLERNEGKHIFPCLLKALVQIDSSDYSFHHIGLDSFLHGSTLKGFSFTDKNIFLKVSVSCHL